jgi:anti-sigma B factor antagonist
MKVQRSNNGRTVTCWAIGDLDRYTFANFAGQVAPLTGPGVHIVIDLSELGYIDSSGVSTLRATAKRVRRAGGQLSLRNPSAHVVRLLTVTGIEAVVPVTRSFARPAS